MSLVLLLCLPTIMLGGTPKYTAHTFLESNSFALQAQVAADPVLDVIYCFGQFEGQLVVGGDTVTSRGQVDGFLACYSTTWQLRWVEQFGGPGADNVQDVVVIPGDGVVATLQCGGNTTSYTTYTIGDVTYSGRGNMDAVVADISADGVVRWSRNDGAERYENPVAIHRFSDGSLAVCGTFGVRSRFDTVIIDAGPGGIGGFLQLLTPDGQQSWVAYSMSDTSVDLPLEDPGTAGFVGFTELTDTSLRVVVKGTGANRIADISFFLHEGGNEVVRFDRAGIPSQPRGSQLCTGPWIYFRSPEMTDGLSGVDPDCTPQRTNWITWHENPYGRKDTITRSYFIDPKASSWRTWVTNIHRSGTRSLICGAFADTIDLLQTAAYPDAIAQSDESSNHPFIILGDDVGTFRRILHIATTGSGSAHSAAYTRSGLAAVLQTSGDLQLGDGTVPSPNGLTLVTFADPTVGVEGDG
ncbi:MAG: hypothetical protein EHM43_12920, partial [Ignavibacteriae bacterium]